MDEWTNDEMTRCEQKGINTWRYMEAEKDINKRRRVYFSSLFVVPHLALLLKEEQLIDKSKGLVKKSITIKCYKGGSV